MEYLSWDVIQRECQPKYPDIHSVLSQPDFLKKAHRYISFFQSNYVMYNAPFIIFYQKQDKTGVISEGMKLQDLMLGLGVPH